MCSADGLMPAPDGVARAAPDAIPASWQAAWDALADDAEEPNPFAERWFVTASARHLVVPMGAEAIAVWHDAQMLGVIVLHQSSRYGRQPIPHMTNWLQDNSFYGAPLIRRGAGQAFWSTLLAHLDAARDAAGFLHLAALDEQGPALAALRAVRRADVVHRSARAMLASAVPADAYYAATVRKKKRKELARLSARLAEAGRVAADVLGPAVDPRPWIGDFLALEASGWKGREGSPMGVDPGKRAFFVDALTAAQASGRLEMIRLALDGRPIAMLVNFVTPPGSYSYKIAYDEAFARFSPGVLIQLENLKRLDRAPGVWMDSCAAPDHPMINSLWGERRSIVRVTTPLRGLRRMALFTAARAIEDLSALRRRRT